MDSQTQKTLLIVDDDPRIRSLLCEALSATGYETLQAADGQEALDIVDQHAIDCIISDIKMPEIDGITLPASLLRVRLLRLNIEANSAELLEEKQAELLRLIRGRRKAAAKTAKPKAKAKPKKTKADQPAEEAAEAAEA